VVVAPYKSVFPALNPLSFLLLLLLGLVASSLLGSPFPLPNVFNYALPVRRLIIWHLLSRSVFTHESHAACIMTERK